MDHLDDAIPLIIKGKRARVNPNAKWVLDGFGTPYAIRKGEAVWRRGEQWLMRSTAGEWRDAAEHPLAGALLHARDRGASWGDGRYLLIGPSVNPDHAGLDRLIRMDEWERVHVPQRTITAIKEVTKGLHVDGLAFVHPLHNPAVIYKADL